MPFVLIIKNKKQKKEKKYDEGEQEEVERNYKQIDIYYHEMLFIVLERIFCLVIKKIGWQIINIIIIIIQYTKIQNRY